MNTVDLQEASRDAQRALEQERDRYVDRITEDKRDGVTIRDSIVCHGVPWGQVTDISTSLFRKTGVAVL